MYADFCKGLNGAIAPHERHAPDLIKEIQETDRRISEVDRSISLTISEPVIRFDEVLVLNELRSRRRALTASAHRIYGHTPARGDRGPSSAGAVAA